MDFENPSVQPPNPDMMSDEEIIHLVFNVIPEIKKYFASLEDYAQQRAEERNPLPGSKLVATRATMKWRDEEEAKKFFSAFEGAFERKFKTAPQMKKLLGKKKFDMYEEKYTHKTSTGVTLVPDSDPRPSARPSGS